MRELLRRAWHLIRRRRFDADLREEMEFHRASIEREIHENGTDSSEARFAARRAIGSVALAQDQARDVWTPRWLQGIGQDVRFAVRSLRATPLVTAVAVLSLALGIGANTALFSLADALLLRPLAVPFPERLALVGTTAVTSYRPPFSEATFEQVRHRQLFEGVAAFTACCSRSVVTMTGEPESVTREFFSGNFFGTVGVRPYLGRLFGSDDDVTGGGPDGQVVVISYGFWRRVFGGSPTIIGTPLHVDHAALTIIGVLPPDFLGLEVGRTFDLAMPVHTTLEPAIPASYDPDAPVLQLLVRLKPGQPLDAAIRDLRAAQPEIRTAAMPREANPDFLKNPFTLESLAVGTSALRQRFERPLLMIFGVALLVLTIACANIGNLMLARSATRHHELSVRLALGAGPWQVVRPALMESVALSALGTVVGVAFAAWTARALVARLSTSTAPVVLNLSLDWRVLAFTATTMVGTALLFGVVPALRAARVAPMDALRDRTLSAPGAGSSAGFGVLLVAQVALSLTCLVAAGLFVRTFVQLVHRSFGFEVTPVLAVTVNAPAIPPAHRKAVYQELVRTVDGVPGVSAAGGSINPPLVGTLVGGFVVSEPGAPLPNDAEVVSQANFITPGFLAAYGTPLLMGRDMNDEDTASSQPVMIVNQAFVHRFLPQRMPIGAALAVTVREPPDGDFPLGTKTIVGVTGDAVFRSVRDRTRPTVYFPLSQWTYAGDTQSLPYATFFMAVRATSGLPASLTRSVASAMAAVNPNITLTVRPLADQVEDALAQDRLIAALAAFFGGVGLLLAGGGLYALTAYAVARRRTEIGIRMALGAAPASIIRLVLSRVSVLVGLGVVVGSIVSLSASTFVASLLYGLTPRDPATLIGSATVLASVAALAGGIPAWRASRIDPAVVLRSE